MRAVRLRDEDRVLVTKDPLPEPVVVTPVVREVVRAVVVPYSNLSVIFEDGTHHLFNVQRSPSGAYVVEMPRSGAVTHACVWAGAKSWAHQWEHPIVVNVGDSIAFTFVGQPPPGMPGMIGSS